MPSPSFQTKPIITQLSQPFAAVLDETATALIEPFQRIADNGRQNLSNSQAISRLMQMEAHDTKSFLDISEVFDEFARIETQYRLLKNSIDQITLKALSNIRAIALKLCGSDSGSIQDLRDYARATVGYAGLDGIIASFRYAQSLLVAEIPADAMSELEKARDKALEVLGSRHLLSQFLVQQIQNQGA